jgi:hypothetical protein
MVLVVMQTELSLGDKWFKGIVGIGQLRQGI